MARLRLNIDDTQTTIAINDTTTLPTNGGVVQIESEEISYTYADDRTIYGCTRGYNSTSAAAHDAELEVELLTEPTSQVSPLEMSAEGAPTDNLTGVKIATTGTRYTNLTNGTIYLNTGDSDEPTWVLLQAGSDLGMTELTGDVEAGPGSGSQVATIADNVVTAAKMDSEAATIGQVLTADGSGEATWEDAAGGVPGGNDTAIQFNDGGAFGGDETKLAWDSGTSTLEMNDSILELNSSNYDITIDPANGGIAGMNSLVGPVDDTLSVSSVTGFDLNLQVQDTGDLINFNFAGDTKFYMDGFGGFYLDEPGCFIDFLDGSGGEVGYFGTGIGGIADGLNMKAFEGIQMIRVGSPSTPDVSAVLELKGTAHGFLPPRMTEAQRDAISTPATGLVVYNTDSDKLNLYNGATWEEVGGGSGSFTPAFYAEFAGIGFTTSSTPVATNITHTFSMADPTHRVKVTVVGDGYSAFTSTMLNTAIGIDGVTGSTQGTIVNFTSGSNPIQTISFQRVFSPGDTDPHVYAAYYYNNDNTNNVVFPQGFGSILVEEII